MTKTNHASFMAAIQTEIKFAFQPIVDIHTGNTYGFEALLRGHNEVGYDSIHELFDDVWNKGILHEVDVALRQKALKSFSEISQVQNYRLFFNMDGRVFESQDYQPDKTKKLLDSYGLSSDTICLEMSELYNNSEAKHIRDILKRCRQQNFRLALDDYGRGFSELKMLYDYQPDYLKIDRFFIDGIAEDQKKKLLVSNMVNMAYTLGINVIAEGVEREKDFHVCRELGCNLVQGYLISRPQLNHDRLRSNYPIISKLNEEDRRNSTKVKNDISGYLEQPLTIQESEDFKEVLDIFRANPDKTFFPVVDAKGEPRGILREKILKRFIYSKYGHALLNNRGLGYKVTDFMENSPIVDINSNLDDMLAIYAMNDISEGILITENLKYKGFLSNRALIQIINEKRFLQAQDQNPLSKLAGNHSINEFIAHAITQQKQDYLSLAYFDFNNFKPFNDHYGFRQGDRAIVLFVEIMKKLLLPEDAFLGHIGGDDFFVGLKGCSPEKTRTLMQDVKLRFKTDVESFYAKEDREKGYILAKDREDKFRKFPLLDSCVAILNIQPGTSVSETESLGDLLASLKKEAKQALDGIAEEHFPPLPRKENAA